MSHDPSTTVTTSAAPPCQRLLLEAAPTGDRRSRREVVRQGAKLAFVAPLLTTFLAREAQAATKLYSCYAPGHACPGAEPCCSGICGGDIGMMECAP